MADLDAIERTALLTAALRAAETGRADRLYADPYAAAFAGDIGPTLLAEVRAATFPSDGRARTLPSTPDYNAIRTRFFDEYLTAAARDFDQLVVAPTGMDSRAFRLSWPRRVRLFEVDRPAVLAVKEEVLGAAATPAIDRRTVATDLKDDGWERSLIAAGYEPDRPSAWLIEGLLYYIPEPDVHRILGTVQNLTASGSLVAADIVNHAALTLPNMRGLLDVFAGWGCPWLFGSDEPEELFARYGIKAEAVQPGEPSADYGRWPDPVPPRSETQVRRVFFVHGKRA
jgi:methyltransferase (TIGR00027 family)